MVTSWPPGTLIGSPEMTPMSLPDASSEPVKVIPPMTMSRTVGIDTSSGMTAAMPASRM